MKHTSVATMDPQSVTVPLWVLDRCRGVSSWVYARLTALSGDGQVIDGYALPDLARLLHLSPRMVQRHLADLAKAGAVDIHHQASVTGQRLPNRIVINTRPPEHAAEDVPEGGTAV
ncbi:hypothetical protein [Streptomyces sp. TR02-1]|uniref:hypothetical protein n=1 Tax=Streptomyces sp. TR02-1 TaxID=3385977 RepID=UPI00399F3523